MNSKVDFRMILRHLAKTAPVIGPFLRQMKAKLRAIPSARALKKAGEAAGEIKLVLGANAHTPAGWLYSDIEVLDITKSGDWERYFKPSSISAILAEHVWEHLTAEDGVMALTLCGQYLQAGSRLRIAVPDAFHPDPAYHDHADPKGSESNDHGHQVFYNIRSLTEAIISAGLTSTPLEWFDEARVFHQVEWNAADGMIRRSSRFDPRNAIRPLSYTSLIIDAIKPL